MRRPYGATSVLLQIAGCMLACMMQTGFAAAAPLPSAGADDNPQTQLAERRASLRRMGALHRDGYGNSFVEAHDMLAATALQGCAVPGASQFMTELPALPKENEPTEMFNLPPLVRYLHQFGSCLTVQQKTMLLNRLNKPQMLFAHGTTNMAMVTASSWYLLAQYFPDQTWTDAESNKKYSSAQVMARLKALLAARTRRVFQSGHYEWLSPNYALLNFYPLLNLIDFSADSEVRQNAQDEATLDVAMLRMHSFHGEIVPPLTRKTVDQRNGMVSPQTYQPAISQLMLWYYFGEPTHLGLYDFRAGSAFFISVLGMSDWVPPAALYGLHQPGASASDDAVRAITSRFTKWGDATRPEIIGDSLISDDFSIGTGNVMFDPQGYSGHIQTFSILLKSARPQNEIECYQPYWHASAGEDAWLADRSSPFQEMLRFDDSSVIMLFDTPVADPWQPAEGTPAWKDRGNHVHQLLQEVTCRFARDFDEIDVQPDWVFVRHDKVFVAMATLHGSNEVDHGAASLLQHYRLVKIREPKTALYFRVERQRADLDFTQFRKMVKAGVPRYDAASSSVAFTDHQGDQMEVRFSLTKEENDNFWHALPVVSRNGHIEMPDTLTTVESPAMTLRNGVLTIKTAAGALTLAHPPLQADRSP